MKGSRCSLLALRQRDREAAILRLRDCRAPSLSGGASGEWRMAKSAMKYHLPMRAKVLAYVRERQLLRAGDRVGVAVSGGADSVALLRVLLELRGELGIVLTVAHFHHGLRGEAADADQAFVAELARHHQLEFFVGVGDVRDHAVVNKLTLEAAARELRYRWLASLASSKKLDAIATGHTLDDQAETVLMKFLRGAGTRGLAGIFPEIKTSETFRIVRPLLSVSRDEVQSYLSALGQEWREDESNRDWRFARNQVRHELLPMLARDYNPEVRERLSDAAEIARGEEKYWQAVVERELAQRLAPGDEDAVRQRTRPCARLELAGFSALPLALQRRMLKRFAEEQTPRLDFRHVEDLRRCAIQELRRVELPGDWLAEREHGWLALRPPRSEAGGADYEYVLRVPGETHIPELGIVVRAVAIEPELAAKAEPGSLLDAELVGGELTVRNWRPGDRFWPAHRGSEEKLKRLFAEKRIPEAERAGWPVALEGGQVVWVRGLPAARAFVWNGAGAAVRIDVLA